MRIEILLSTIFLLPVAANAVVPIRIEEDRRHLVSDLRKTPILHDSKHLRFNSSKASTEDREKWLAKNPCVNQLVGLLKKRALPPWTCAKGEPGYRILLTGDFLEFIDKDGKPGEDIESSFGEIALAFGCFAANPPKDFTSVREESEPIHRIRTHPSDPACHPPTYLKSIDEELARIAAKEKEERKKRAAIKANAEGLVERPGIRQNPSKKLPSEPASESTGGPEGKTEAKPAT
jgi:hypothetical protein